MAPSEPGQNVEPESHYHGVARCSGFESLILYDDVYQQSHK